MSRRSQVQILSAATSKPRTIPRWGQGTDQAGIPWCSRYTKESATEPARLTVAQRKCILSSEYFKVDSAHVCLVPGSLSIRKSVVVSYVHRKDVRRVA